MNKRAVLIELRELRRRCDTLIETIETEPVANALDLIDQSISDLGPKRHCAAVRRRIQRDEPGAFKDGRRHMLTPEAYQEERQRLFRPSVAKATAPTPHVATAENDNDEAAAAVARLKRKLGRA